MRLSIFVLPLLWTACSPSATEDQPQHPHRTTRVSTTMTLVVYQKLQISDTNLQIDVRQSGIADVGWGALAAPPSFEPGTIDLQELATRIRPLLLPPPKDTSGYLIYVRLVADTGQEELLTTTDPAILAGICEQLRQATKAGKIGQPNLPPDVRAKMAAKLEEQWRRNKPTPVSADWDDPPVKH